MYVAGHNVFYKSTDAGRTWEQVQHNLPGTDIHGFTIGPDDQNSLYAFVVGAGLFRSENGGRAWERVAGQLPPSTMGLAVAPAKPNVLLAGTMDAGLWRKEGSGGWARVSGGLGGRTAMALAAAATPGVVYAGTEKGLFRSDDAGVTWRATGLGTAVMAVAVSPQDQALLLVVDDKGRVYRSADGGASWGR